MRAIREAAVLKRVIGAGHALAASVLCAGAVHADEGMWLLTSPPTKQLQDRYGFTTTGAWLEHVQKSCTRILSGGSGSIVSPNGLVMTNHHVAFDQLIKLSTAERDIVRDGYLAKGHAQELKCPDMEVQTLQHIEDRTDEVMGAVAAGMDATAAGKARRSKIADIEKHAEEETGLDCEIVTLYGGARYHLYCYKTYTDVRLAFAPESAAAAFGGDIDNFEYPRWCLDCTFFRIYEDGRPVRCEHYLPFQPGGSEAGDLVFVFGHPGRTQRLNTVEHLRFARDTDYPGQLRQIWRREVQLLNFADRSAENARIAKDDLLGFQNSRKAYTGFLAGLRDPSVMDAKRRAEITLRKKAASDPEHGREWGEAWETIETAYGQFEEFYADWLLTIRRPFMYSDLWRKAHTIVQYVEEIEKPNGERLPEFRDSNLESLELALFSEAPIYEALEIDRLRSALGAFADVKGTDDPFVRMMLDGRSPEELAIELATGSKLYDVWDRKKLIEGGASAVARSSDPMIVFARRLDIYAREIGERYRNEVQSPTRDAYAKIVAARFKFDGEDTYPDATFSLRLSFGTVKGYEEPGAGSVEPYTTMGGLFGRMRERGPSEPFALPSNWKEAEDRLDMSTPYNLVSTNDIIGGNSGSPLVNTEGEVVGLIFDGNIQSLVWGTQFDDTVARSVSVDVRGILEAMEKVYGAGALVEELRSAAE